MIWSANKKCVTNKQIKNSDNNYDKEKEEEIVRKVFWELRIHS